jgi:tetrahydromethanopterin S-methyltransferase subunit C
MLTQVKAAFSHPNARLLVSGVLCSLLGVVIAWCTNAAMVEVSINAIFALYFGA